MSLNFHRGLTGHEGSAASPALPRHGCKGKPNRGKTPKGTHEHQSESEDSPIPALNASREVVCHPRALTDNQKGGLSRRGVLLQLLTETTVMGKSFRLFRRHHHSSLFEIHLSKEHSSFLEQQPSLPRHEPWRCRTVLPAVARITDEHVSRLTWIHLRGCTLRSHELCLQTSRQSKHRRQLNGQHTEIDLHHTLLLLKKHSGFRSPPASTGTKPSESRAHTLVWSPVGRAGQLLLVFFKSNCTL